MEIGDVYAGKLGIAGAAQQRAADDRAQRLGAGVDQPAAFVAIE
jgi:hypothetical protein